MSYWSKGGSVLLLLLMCWPAAGQYSPYVPVQQKLDPRQRRARLEQAVVKAGPGARQFVEAFGDEAADAIFACTPMTGLKLAEAQAELERMSRPRDVLRVIAQPKHGDDVARYVIAHTKELQDADNLSGFLVSGLEISLGLLSLEQKGSEFRAARLNASVPAPTPDYQDWRIIAFAGGFASLGILLYWWRRRSGDAKPILMFPRPA